MQNRLAKWERLREKGKWNYILKFGVIGWGITSAVVFALVFSLLTHVSFWTVLPISLVLFPLGGIGWGYYMWSLSEKAYRKAITSEQGAAPDADKPLK